MIYDITELVPLQAELDKDIAIKHNVTYENTTNKRLLALMVELSELANSTRTFKYWSNKGPESRERVLDEAADVLHFYLSKFIELDITVRIFDISLASKRELTDLFIYDYNLLAKYYENRDVEIFLESFKVYLLIVSLLGFDNKELIAGYKSKLQVNYSRQKSNY